VPLLERATLRQLYDRILADLASRPGVDVFLRRSFERALAFAMAAVAHGLYGYLEGLATELSPRTCGEKMLLAWCSVFRVTRKSPTKATGAAVFPGTNGSVLATGTVMQRSDGVRYIVTAGATVASGFVSVPVEAEVVGADGNVEGPSALRLASPVSGIQTVGAFDASGASGGTDLESVDDLRVRLLERIQKPQRGGSTDDYIAWVKETPNVDVQNVYVFPYYYGPGTVGVTFTVPGDDPIPTEPQRAAVFDYVDPLRPEDMAGFGTFVPIAQPVTYTIAIRPFSLEVKNAISTSLADLHSREAIPGGALLHSHITEAISTAAGETDHDLIAPAADVVPLSSIHLPTFSTPSYSELT